MNVHEYQAKRLLGQFDVPTPVGDVAYNTHEAERIANWLDEDVMVVKAQIHAGGRGLGGGVKVVKSVADVVKSADAMFGMMLKTPQTPPEGKKVRRVYIEKGVNIDKEIYFCVVVNRATGGVDIIASKEGGMDIEEIAQKKPKSIMRVSLPAGARLGFAPCAPSVLRAGARRTLGAQGTKNHAEYLAGL